MAWLASALALGACYGPAQPRRFPMLFRCVSDPGRPLGGVRLSLGGATLGHSDAAGELRLFGRGHAGETLRLEVHCPAGYAAPAAPLDVPLRLLAAGAEPPEMRVHCAPLERTLVVAVRARGGAGVPVVVGGRVVAKTNVDGVAHVLLRVPVGERVRVRIDTSERPELQPQNPTREYAPPGRDELVVFNQAFWRKPRPKRRRRSLRPVRI